MHVVKIRCSVLTVDMVGGSIFCRGSFIQVKTVKYGFVFLVECKKGEKSLVDLRLFSGKLTKTSQADQQEEEREGLFHI